MMGTILLFRVGRPRSPFPGKRIPPPLPIRRKLPFSELGRDLLPSTVLALELVFFSLFSFSQEAQRVRDSLGLPRPSPLSVGPPFLPFEEKQIKRYVPLFFFPLWPGKKGPFFPPLSLVGPAADKKGTPRLSLSFSPFPFIFGGPVRGFPFPFLFSPPVR